MKYDILSILVYTQHTRTMSSSSKLSPVTERLNAMESKMDKLITLYEIEMQKKRKADDSPKSSKASKSSEARKASKSSEARKSSKASKSSKSSKKTSQGFFESLLGFSDDSSSESDSDSDSDDEEESSASSFKYKCSSCNHKGGHSHRK